MVRGHWIQSKKIGGPWVKSHVISAYFAVIAFATFMQAMPESGFAYPEVGSWHVGKMLLVGVELDNGVKRVRKYINRYMIDAMSCC